MRAVFQIILGAILGIFLLLFFMANDDWVVIRLPSLPWHASPSWPFMEARLFGVMLISFALGVLSFALIAMVIGRRRQRFAEAKEQRIDALEKELEKANRLMAAAKNSDKQ